LCGSPLYSRRNSREDRYTPRNRHRLTTNLVNQYHGELTTSIEYPNRAAADEGTSRRARLIAGDATCSRVVSALDALRLASYVYSWHFGNVCPTWPIGPVPTSSTIRVLVVPMGGLCPLILCATDCRSDHLTDWRLMTAMANGCELPPIISYRDRWPKN
jgi:hypothetical protein